MEDVLNDEAIQECVHDVSVPGDTNSELDKKFRTIIFINYS